VQPSYRARILHLVFGIATITENRVSLRDAEIVVTLDQLLECTGVALLCRIQEVGLRL
jgi:hypothetical protein